jgi:sugar phosphate isomerase/epimerase
MIYISTGGEKSKTAFETAQYFFKNGIDGIELSGGKYSPTYQADLLKLSLIASLQVHNYFPPPIEPFVLNLASADSLVLSKSIAHVKQSIHLAALLNRPMYSFHAGFRVDPHARELGVKLGQSKLTDRNIALDIFGHAISDLSEIARREGVTLLIENNVLSKGNLAIFGDNPLLLTSPDEILSFMKVMPKNIGVLLDVAHLKVSSQTLNFDLVGAHELLRDLIQAYHLSDNDGQEDTNHVVTEGSWFWPYLKPNLDSYTLEVYGEDAESLLRQKQMVSGRLASLRLQKNGIRHAD